MYQAPNAPESIGGVLDAGFKLYPACVGKVFVPAMLGSLATSLPASLGQALLDPSGDRFAQYFVLVAALLLVGVAVACVLMAAVVARIDAVANGRAMTLGESVRFGARRAPALFGAILLSTLAIVVGFVLVVVPGVIVGVWFAFGVVATVVDRRGPVESLIYSTQLTRGHWWRTFVLLSVAFGVLLVFYSVIVTVVALVVALMAASGGSIEALAAQGPPWYVDLLIGPLVAGAITPLVYGLWIAIYYDLRLRREGTDLTARIDAAIGTAAATV